MSLMERQATIRSDDDLRFEAVMSRTGRPGDPFVYGVRSTRIFCRPTCPSRRPKRENIVLFSSSAEAAAAGFRPCLRCRPEATHDDSATADRIARACRMIEELDHLPSLDELAGSVGMSRYHFHRTFKAVTGLTPKAYADQRRAERVRSELAGADASVTRAIYEAGFNASSRFYEKADEFLGMTPTAYRNGGADAQIRFAIGETSLGALLVACSDRGVCAILLGDDPEALLQDLQDRFPRANLIGGDDAFEQMVAQVIALVEQPERSLSLPLDLQGTAFQRRVWQALREIPPGETATYAEIARRIGAPGAHRAVAGACAANPVAIAVPCHRVLRSDGNLSGYRWGVDRKRALLARERKLGRQG
jgi:AraC family transcriptional regulator of adaptative response/methylated-DNA-[protein]-cysteine methyltransferase